MSSCFRRRASEAWHTKAADTLLPHGTHCAHCGGSAFRRETDILDVWFDSGSSWHAVLEQEPGLAPPADLYFEGGDQYRGWFHTSLLTSVGVGEQHETPFRMVGTAGWTLDEQGRAMSKSLGNGVDPVDIADRLGAEIVRLWVASVDFREDVVSSEQIMQRLAENYRKLRNTFRFLLGNLADFDPARDAVADAELLPLDRYMLARAASSSRKFRRNGWQRRLVRRLPVPPRLSRGQRILHRRSQRVLSRRAQGPPLHLRAERHRTPLRADRSLEDRRSARPPGRTDSHLHGG